MQLMGWCGQLTGKCRQLTGNCRLQLKDCAILLDDLCGKNVATTVSCVHSLPYFGHMSLAPAASMLWQCYMHPCYLTFYSFLVSCGRVCWFHCVYMRFSLVFCLTACLWQSLLPPTPAPKFPSSSPHRSCWWCNLAFVSVFFLLLLFPESFLIFHHITVILDTECAQSIWAISVLLCLIYSWFSCTFCICHFVYIADVRYNP